MDNYLKGIIKEIKEHKNKIKGTMNREKASTIADELYFMFIDSLHDNVAVEYVETDPDNDDGGTRNTEKGSELYYAIENRIADIK
tara:strand:- start:998 stop:1252 length:255 start_codon:yes stop_codon:yes gene_type:complete